MKYNNQNVNNSNESNYSFNYDVRSDVKDYDRKMNNQGSNKFIYFLLAKIASILTILSCVLGPITGIPAIILEIIASLKIGFSGSRISIIMTALTISSIWTVIILVFITELLN